VFWRVSWRFVCFRTRDALNLLAQDGITGWKAYRGLLRYTLLKPGILRRVFPLWLSYLRPGFHPWDHDDRALIRSTLAELERGSEASSA